MKTNHQDQPTVLLRVDSDCVSVNTIDLAIAMAASVESRIHGLFVENQDLLRVASLPFSREISSSTAREHQTSLDQMQRSLRAMAAQFRNSLEQAAQASQVPWSFDYISDHSGDDESRLLQGITYTIVGQRISTRNRSKQFRPVRRVLLIENHSPQLTHALTVVLQRFKEDRVEVTVVTDRVAGETKADLQVNINTLEQRISVIEIERDQLTELLTKAGSSYDCVIMSMREGPDSQQLMSKYLQCPVIIVS